MTRGVRRPQNGTTKVVTLDKKNIVGGRIGAYTQMCEQARQQAYDAMLAHAREMGANAILGVRYDASEVVSKGSATEVLCYGTAVVVKEDE